MNQADPRIGPLVDRRLYVSPQDDMNEWLAALDAADRAAGVVRVDKAKVKDAAATLVQVSYEYGAGIGSRKAVEAAGASFAALLETP